MSSDYLSGGEGWSYTATPIEASKTNTNLFSTYASLNLKNSGIFGAELGGRINSHSVYGSNSTFTINPYILLKNSAKFFVNYSSSFKVPSQYQLYSEYGNADLKPTTAATFEIGTQLFTKDKKANVRAVYFDRSTKDIIIYQSLSVAPWGKYVNFDKQHDYGVEIEGTATVELLTVTANYTFVEGSVTTVVAGKEETYQNLFRRPKNSFNLSLGYNVTPKWNIQHTIHSVSQAASGPYDDKTVILGNYTTIDLYQGYQITPVLKAFLDIKNLTDIEYYDIPGYNSRRFNFMAGLQAKF
jgi:vitamin B12 transporter